MKLTKSDKFLCFANKNNIDYNVINAYEEKFKHDIMAHLYAFSDLCPIGKNMIHLGATSNFINDNADMILASGSTKYIIDLVYKLIDKSVTY